MVTFFAAQDSGFEDQLGYYVSSALNLFYFLITLQSPVLLGTLKFRVLHFMGIWI